MGQPLGHAPGVDEDQGRSVLFHVPGDPVEDVTHLLPGGHRFEILTRQLDGEIEVPPMAHVHHLAPGAAIGVATTLPCSHEEPGQSFDGALGGRESDPGRAPGTQFIQTFETEREMRSALVPGHGMDFIDDYRTYAGQHGAAALGGQEQVKGFRSRDQNLGRVFEHGDPGRSGRVAASQPDAQFGNRVAAAASRLGNFLQGFGQVVLNIGCQRLQGRDVDNFNPGGRRHPSPLLGQGRRPAAEERKSGFTPATLGLGGPFVEAIDADEERGQCLARTRRRGDQRVVARRNHRPAVLLGERRTFGKASLKPFPHRRVKAPKFSSRSDHRPCRPLHRDTFAAGWESAK